MQKMKPTSIITPDQMTGSISTFKISVRKCGPHCSQCDMPFRGKDRIPGERLGNIIQGSLMSRLLADISVTQLAESVQEPEGKQSNSVTSSAYQTLLSRDVEEVKSSRVLIDYQAPYFFLNPKSHMQTQSMTADFDELIVENMYLFIPFSTIR